MRSTAGLDEGPLTSAAALTISTCGRRSGRAHRVTVWFAYGDGCLFFLAHARRHGRGTDWYRNLLAAGSATVDVRGTRYLVRPEAFPPGTDALATAVGLFEQKYGPGAVADWYVPTERIPVRVRVHPADSCEAPSGPGDGAD